MSAEGAIPPRIRDALDTAEGYVLVVAGRPGTGKTLFVHEVFREFEDSFLILSNAEATSSSEEKFSSMPQWANRHVIAQYWRPIDTSSLHESTLSEQISSLLGNVSIKDQHNIVIIDSWTDFLMPIDTKDRYRVQQAMIYAARKEGKKLILVTEGEWTDGSRPQLHHSADAIVQLRKLRKDQRLYRQLTIDKMRNMSIEQDSFLFTLNNGRFTYIPWYVHQFPPIMVGRDSIPDPTDSRVSTGNRSLDLILNGGFEKSSLSLIEVENLAAPYLETIYIPFLSNQLQLGRPAVILLPEGWSPDRFIEGLSHFVDPNVILKQVIFFGRHALGHENAREIDDDPWKTLQEIRYESTQLERKFYTQTTELFALDTLENKYGVNDVKGMMAEITASLPTNERTIVTILSQEQALRSSSIAYSVHLRVQELSGVLSVCGVNPKTNYLAVRPLLSKGFLDYDLVPIV
ncbi:MAG: ATPase domain-containing protein [Candidatus Thorarchaeota archaeon]